MHFLWLASLIAVLASLFSVRQCRTTETARVNGVYAHDTRALVRLDYDYDGDGRIDVRTYIRDGRPVRLEGDGDGDGLIDRWEYYAPTGELLRIGASSEADGREDTWIQSKGDERLVEVSTARDALVDRREIYRGDAIVRTEADTNRDGLTDRWEEFRDGAVVRVLLDDGRRLGRPTRRLTYVGSTVQIETDADGDGRFEPVPHPDRNSPGNADGAR